MGIEARRRIRNVFDVLRAPRYTRFGPEAVRWQDVRRWVFVCQGNVCRSPFGEYWARGRGIPAVSCGTEAIAGKPADPSAIRNAAAFGVDLAPHGGTPLSDFPSAEGDLFICFDDAHIPPVDRSRAGTPRTQVLLLGLCLPRRSVRIEDPYGKDDACFTLVYAKTQTGLGVCAARMRDDARVGRTAPQ